VVFQLSFTVAVIHNRGSLARDESLAQALFGADEGVGRSAGEMERGADVSGSRG